MDEAVTAATARGNVIDGEPEARGRRILQSRACLEMIGLNWRWIQFQVNRLGIVLVGLWIVAHVWPQAPIIDDVAYYNSGHGPLYPLAWNTLPSSYIYSPAFAQLVGPLTALPYLVFHWVLGAAQLVALMWLIGPVAAAVFLWIPFLGGSYVWNGNIVPLLAVALVLDWWPALLLTKVLPGVGALYLVGARQWRRLELLVLATGAIVAISFAFWPGAWFAWVQALVVATQSPIKGWAIPLVVRLPIAALLAWSAGATGRRWLVPVAVAFSLADVGWSSLAWLTAVPRLRAGQG